MKTMRTADEAQRRDPPRAPVRVMQVLEALSTTRAAVSLASLSTQLSLPKTSLMHLLRSLESGGYVRRVDAGYKLGQRSFRLAASIGTSTVFEEVAADVLQALRDATQETALLGAFSADRRSAVYVERRASPQAMRFAPEVGEQRPLYSSGLGKLLLAFAAPEFVETYLRSVKLVPHARRTLRTRAALRQALAEIRATGVSVSIDEMADGGSAIAAPVFGARGEIHAALVLAVPTARFLTQRRKLEALLRKGAEELSGSPLS